MSFYKVPPNYPYLSLNGVIVPENNAVIGGIGCEQMVQNNRFRDICELYW